MRKDTVKALGKRVCLLGASLVIVGGLLVSGCGKSGDEDMSIAASNPKQAASQLEQVFENAPSEIKETAGIASDALRQGDYEKAVVSLEAIRAREGITLEQGLAIHSSVVTMEERLVRGMEAGDERARRAYQLLKQMKRN